MKVVIVIMLTFVFTAGVFGTQIDSSLLNLIDELSEKYAEQSGMIYTKRNIAVLGIENQSESAEKNFIAEGITALLKPLLGKSLLFQLVDRENLDEITEEMKISLSGLTDDSSSVKIGEIENVHVLLAGTITEGPGHFIITLQMIDVETSRVAAVGECRIEKEILIKESNRIAYEYVTANGLGLSLQGTPLRYLMFPADGWADMESELGGLSIFGILTYRLNKYLKFSLHTGFKGHAVYYDDRSYGAIENIDPVTLAELTDNATAPDLYNIDGSVDDATAGDAINAAPIYLHISQDVIHLSFLCSGVLPITRELNISLGVGPALNYIVYNQAYDNILVEFRDGARFTARRYEHKFFGIGAEAMLQVEYFILPRFSINLSADYHHNFYMKAMNEGCECLSTGEYLFTRDDRDLAAFGLNPFQLPDGTELDENTFNGNFLNIILGFSIYF